MGEVTTIPIQAIENQLPQPGMERIKIAAQRVFDNAGEHIEIYVNSKRQPGEYTYEYFRMLAFVCGFKGEAIRKLRGFVSWEYASALEFARAGIQI